MRTLTLTIYSKVVELMEEVFEILPEGVDLSKGGLGELALADHLGQYLHKGDKGADAYDMEGNYYEYKISTTDQFNFHFGSRVLNPEASVEKHFKNIKGAYCAKRVGMKIVDCAYVPTELLVPALIKHFNSTKGGQLNKNYSMAKFKALQPKEI